MPKVSIAIPTIGRDFFKYAYLSAINQTYKDLEIIVCNYSDKNFPEKIMEEYPDKRVKYFKLPDPGRLEGYRRAIQLTNGKFIKLLLDDDMLHKKSIATMVNILENNQNVVIVTSNRIIINEKNEPQGKFDDTFKKNEIIDGIRAGDIMLYNISNFIGEPSTCLFRVNDLTEPFGRFSNKDALSNDDVATWLTLLTKGKLAYITEPLSYFRVHPKQVQQKYENLGKAIIDWFNHLFDGRQYGYAKNNKYFYKALLKILLNEKMSEILDNSDNNIKLVLSEYITKAMNLLKEAKIISQL